MELRAHQRVRARGRRAIHPSRKVECEGTALAELRCDLNGSAVSLNDDAANVESEPHAFNTPARWIIHPVKALEEVRHSRRGYARNQSRTVVRT